MKFFFKNDHMGPSFQIFLIFQLLSGGVTNLFSCTKLLVVTCRRVENYFIPSDSHTLWENGLFVGWGECKYCDFSTLWHFYFFHFPDLSVCFSAKFQQLGMESVSNVYLWPILLSPGNNGVFTGVFTRRCAACEDAGQAAYSQRAVISCQNHRNVACHPVYMQRVHSYSHTHSQKLDILSV